ncbi:MAG: lipopolysaccharide kinase InaA family protein [Thermoguttaceae bacterium]
MMMSPIAQETFWIDPEFQPLLQHAGWDQFDRVMAATDGFCWRSMPDRENWRFDLPDGDGGQRRVYLKKHHVRLKQRRRTKTAARIEAENTLRLREIGVPNMRVIAFGERFRDDGLVESFLITEELAGFFELQFFLPERFATRPRKVTVGRDRTLDDLIRRTAELARTFHDAGFNHRDFYAGHFFVRESPPGQFELRLIDLQRVQHRKRWRRHWIVKDLAQLAWSVPPELISCTHRLAFMRTYLNTAKLRPDDKRLIRAVAAKQQWMQRRLGDMREHSRPFGQSVNRVPG